MCLEEQRLEVSNLIHDRDMKFTAGFDQLLHAASVRVVKSPVIARNANAFAGSWIATVRRECLDHFAYFSLGDVDHLAHTFTSYCNRDRPYQSLGNRVLSLSGTPELKLSQDHGLLVRLAAIPSRVACSRASTAELFKSSRRSASIRYM